MLLLDPTKREGRGLKLEIMQNRYKTNQRLALAAFVKYDPIELYQPDELYMILSVNRPDILMAIDEFIPSPDALARGRGVLIEMINKNLIEDTGRRDQYGTVIFRVRPPPVGP